MCKVMFRAEKETQNTHRFAEIVKGDEKPVIGMLYIPKNTLNIMGWNGEDNLAVEVTIAAEEKAAKPKAVAKANTSKSDTKAAEKPAKVTAKATAKTTGKSTAKAKAKAKK